MRGIALIFVASLAGTGSAAVAQDDAAAADMQAMIESCVPADLRTRPNDRLSAAARSSILACVARESARMLNAQLPLRIDEITTLRSVSSDGPELTYLNDVEVDAASLTTAQSAALIETTRAYVCGQPAMRAALSAGSSYRYIWFDRTGAEFNRMTIERCADEAEEEADMAMDDEPEETPAVTIARRDVIAGANG